MFTQFSDMHSGGGCKEKPYELIFIEAPEEEAIVIFYNRFGHNPNRVTCTCCGNDYSIDESKTLEEATAYHRGCKWSDKSKGYIEEPSEFAKGGKVITLEEFCKLPHVLVIRASDIKPEEREGEVPEQGYVWVN